MVVDTFIAGRCGERGQQTGVPGEVECRDVVTWKMWDRGANVPKRGLGRSRAHP